MQACAACAARPLPVQPLPLPAAASACMAAVHSLCLLTAVPAEHVATFVCGTADTGLRHFLRVFGGRAQRSVAALAGPHPRLAVSRRHRAAPLCPARDTHPGFCAVRAPPGPGALCGQGLPGEQGWCGSGMRREGRRDSAGGGGVMGGQQCGGGKQQVQGAQPAAARAVDVGGASGLRVGPASCSLLPFLPVTPAALRVPRPPSCAAGGRPRHRQDLHRAAVSGQLPQGRALLQDHQLLLPHNAGHLSAGHGGVCVCVCTLGAAWLVCGLQGGSC